MRWARVASEGGGDGRAAFCLCPRRWRLLALVFFSCFFCLFSLSSHSCSACAHIARPRPSAARPTCGLDLDGAVGVGQGVVAAVEAHRPASGQRERRSSEHAHSSEKERPHWHGGRSEATPGAATGKSAGGGKREKREERREKEEAQRRAQSELTAAMETAAAANDGPTHSASASGRRNKELLTWGRVAKENEQWWEEKKEASRATWATRLLVVGQASPGAAASPSPNCGVYSRMSDTHEQRRQAQSDGAGCGSLNARRPRASMHSVAGGAPDYCCRPARLSFVTMPRCRRHSSRARHQAAVARVCASRAQDKPAPALAPQCPPSVRRRRGATAALPMLGGAEAERRLDRRCGMVLSSACQYLRCSAVGAE